MKGEDVTPEMMKTAEEFLIGRMKSGEPKLPEVVTIRREDFVRIVAWYGGIRADGAQKGMGAKPGKIYAHGPHSEAAACRAALRGGEGAGK